MSPPTPSDAADLKTLHITTSFYSPTERHSPILVALATAPAGSVELDGDLGVGAVGRGRHGQHGTLGVAVIVDHSVKQSAVGLL